MSKKKQKPVEPAKKCKLCRQDSRPSENHLPPLIFTVRDEEGNILYTPTICIGCCVQLWNFVNGLIRKGILGVEKPPEKKIILPGGVPPGGIIKPS